MLLLAKIFNGSAAETNAPASSVPKVEVRAYRLEGDTALLPESDGVISNYTGQVDLARLHEGLDRLQLFYRRSGFPNLSVTLPQQTLNDGVVRVKIANPLSAGMTNAPGRPYPVFEVLGYRVEGSAVLPPEQLGLLSNYTGRVDLARLHEGLDRLQLICRQSGFSNLSVTLPQQEFTNGIVRLEIADFGSTGIAVAPAPGSDHECGNPGGKRTGPGHEHPGPAGADVRSTQLSHRGQHRSAAGKIRPAFQLHRPGGIRARTRGVGQIAIALPGSGFRHHQRYAAAAKTDQWHCAREGG